MPILNIVTTALATSNRIRINLYKESSPTAIVEQQTHDAPHGQLTWSFSNLTPSEVYRYRWIEIDGLGNTLQEYANQIFTAPANGGVSHRPTEYLRTGETVGMTAGATVVVFDGTGGKMDFRGWNVTIDRPGFGDQFPAENHTWDKVTGTWTLAEPLQPGEKYTFQFDPKFTALPAAEAKDLWGAPLIVTATTTLSVEDIKKKIIIEGSGPYLEITLPDVSVIPENKLIYIESSTEGHKCAAIISTGNNIKWLKGLQGRLYICPSESIQLYRLGSVLRVHHSDGNFKTVGQIINEYSDLADVINKVALDGTVYDIYEHARLYDYVQKLSVTMTFDQWSIGTNKYYYSLANLSGKFHVPDIRGLYARAAAAGQTPGTYLANQNRKHGHSIKTTASGSSTSNDADPIRGSMGGSPNARGQAAGNDDINSTIGLNGGDEARPETYVTNTYVLV